MIGVQGDRSYVDAGVPVTLGVFEGYAHGDPRFDNPNARAGVAAFIDTVSER